MFSKRSLSPTALVAALGIAAGAAALSPTASAGDKKCSGKATDSKVIAACKAGGLDEAKKLMKGWTKAAEKKGLKLKCKDCHEDTKTYNPEKLKGDAKDKYKELKAKAGA